MIPVNDTYSDIKLVRHPTYTYSLDFEKKRIVKYCDGLAAMEQFIHKALQTDRYRHEIYDWSYGLEIDDLLGKPLTVVKAKLPRRIKEALIYDDRVTEVDNFTFPEPDNDKKTTVCVAFTVKTIFGNIEITKEVNLNV